MFNLMRNEWMKIWRKKSTWIMTCILILSIITVAALSRGLNNMPASQPDANGVTVTTTEKDTRDWRERVQEDLVALKANLNEEPHNKEIQDSIMVAQYRLDHDVAPPTTTMTTESFLDTNASMTMMILLFTAIVAGGIVSSEFTQGTIKMLLTRPVSRAKILLAKLSITFLYSIFLSVISFVTVVICAYAFFSSSDGAMLAVVDDEVVKTNPWTTALLNTAYAYISVIMSTLLAFLLGSVFRSSALAIGITMFITFIGTTIMLFISKYSFAKFIWLAHLDVRNPLVDTSTTFSVMILLITGAIFIAISFFDFIKRDVTA